MSFLLVSGKIFFCNECGKSVKIEYEGGALYTQIGDNNIIYQLELAGQFEQPSDRPDVQGYYLYDIGLCEKCLENVIDFDTRCKIEEFINNINFIITTKTECIDNLLKLVPDYLQRFTNSMNISDIEQVTGCQFDPYFGDKHSLASKRKRKINAFVDKNKSIFESYLLKNFLIEDTTVKKIAQWKHVIKSNRTKIDILKNNIDHIYFSKRTNDPENLNDYIQSSTSVRNPVHGAQNELFYYPTEIDKESLEDIFNIENDIPLHVFRVDSLQQLIEKMINV